MKKNKVTFLHSSYEIIDFSGKILGSRRAKNYDNFYNLVKSCDIGLSTVTIKRKNFSKNLEFPKIKTKEDFVLWLKILKNGIKLDSLDKKLVKWRKSKDSLSSSIFQKLKDGFKVYNYYLKFSVIKSIFYLLILSFNALRKKIINL